jgi:hypothetical protein
MSEDRATRFPGKDQLEKHLAPQSLYWMSLMQHRKIKSQHRINGGSAQIQTRCQHWDYGPIFGMVTS